MKWLLGLPLLLASAPANADTVYLLIKSVYIPYRGGGAALHSLPMNSIEECEEAGALIISSSRLKLKSTQDAFECIKGK